MRFGLLVGSMLSAVLLAATSAVGLVNPSLQPRDLFERHDNVVILRVAAIVEDARKITLEVIDCPKGKFEPRKVTMSVEADGPVEAFQSMVAPDQVLTAYFGKASGRRGDDVTIYFVDGNWGLAKKGADDAWTWAEAFEPLDDKSMFGTFNGDGRRLAEMMRDAAAGTVFFPAQPFEQFDKDVVLAKLAETATGVAVHDLDGDGRLDVVAVSKAGAHVLMQTGALKFEDKTQALGLDQARGAGVSVADANADGKADLLIGGAIYVATGSGYLRSDLPAAAKDAVQTQFVDLNCDGWPDVLVSRPKGGLVAYVNPGKGGGAFADATKDLGLTGDKLSGGEGYVCAGDVNGDGKPDLFYSFGPGLLLVGGTAGFSPGTSKLRLDFSVTDETRGFAGGGCMAPLWRVETMDLGVATDAAVNFMIWRDGKLIDASAWANEITESELGLVGVLAEDLNADGNVDVYALNCAGFANVFYTNRGYGSFMTPHKYAKGLFPGAAHNEGSRAAAAGDVDGDGANDLVLAARDGTLCLMRNATLARRRKEAQPTWHQSILDRTSIASVTVSGPLGVLGATVTLKDAKGAVVARRIVGCGDAPGCRGADTLNIAVRQPGKYTLDVVFSDGLKRSRELDLTKPAQHVKTTVCRDAPTSGPVTAPAAAH